MPDRSSRPGYEETLRRLALGEEAFVGSIMSPGPQDLRRPFESAEGSVIDPRTRRLVTLGALIAIDAGAAAIDAAVSAAFGAGATPEDVVDVLIAVAPAVGSARVVDAAPHLAAAIGYDIASAFEDPP